MLKNELLLQTKTWYQSLLQFSLKFVCAFLLSQFYASVCLSYPPSALTLEYLSSPYLYPQWIALS